jgi:hypothetical protein
MTDENYIELYKIAAELTALAIQKTMVEHTTSDQIAKLFNDYKNALVKEFEADTYYEPPASIPLYDEQF